MKDFTRKLDDLGRLCLPAELRRAHGIEEGQPVALINVPDGILIRSTANRCAHCTTDHDLVEINGSAICEACARQAVFKHGLKE